MELDQDEWTWREKGKCWGAFKSGRADALDPWFPPETFTGLQGTPHQFRHETDAAKLCAGCPVIEQCFEFAVEHKDLVGVWGGTLLRQRRLERRRRSRQASWARRRELDTSQVAS